MVETSLPISELVENKRKEVQEIFVANSAIVSVRHSITHGEAGGHTDKDVKPKFVGKIKQSRQR